MIMTPKFDIGKILLSYIGYKGLPYPGAFIGMLKRIPGKQPEYEGIPQGQPLQEFTNKGTRLYKKDYLGRWYFMPVTFITDSKEKYEIPEAVLSITGKKTIVETPMVGRKGSVKELISIDDYKVSIILLIFQMILMTIKKL